MTYENDYIHIMSEAKNNQLLHYGIVLVLLALSGVIIRYYWNTEGVDGIKFVPMYVMILAFVYVLFQILKRYLYKEYNWWDWLYYIGLASMMLPTLLASEENLNLMSILTDIGTLFLVFPILLDAFKLIRSK